MTMTYAHWRPGWYELDQALEVGREAQFAFFQPQPGDPDQPLVFHNTLWRPEEAVVARGTVAKISHPVLGAILKIETEGLDYTFVLADGRHLVVDAEEEPGRLMEETAGKWRRFAPEFASWNVLVEIADLSPLEPAPWRVDPT